MSGTGPTIGDTLVSAIHGGTLRETVARLRSSGPAETSELDAAAAALNALDRRQDADAARWSERFREAGIPHTVTRPEPSSLISIPELRVDPGDVDRAVDLARRAGLLLWTPTSGSGARAVRRTTDRLVLASVGDVPERLVIRWAETPPRLAPLAPRRADLTGRDLPGWLWPVHLGRRLVRTALERTGRVTGTPDLGPLLVTPVPLADALMASLDLGPEDVVVDLGCGDGRLLVAAIEAGAGRARGIEVEAAVAASARERVADAGLDDRIEIETGDASGHRLDDATVVVMFVAAWAAAEQVAAVRRRMPAGRRIVAHELEPITTTPAAETRPLFTDEAITVRHVWRT